MQPVGWGKAKPVSQGIDDAARALNRRVEFNVLQQ
jgi:outer membrane protein OmpA-like peptidoglycan-associated protein